MHYVRLSDREIASLSQLLYDQIIWLRDNGDYKDWLSDDDDLDVFINTYNRLRSIA